MEQIIEFGREIWQTLRSGGFPDLGWWSYLLLMLLAATEGPFSVLLGAAAAAAGYLRLDYVYLAAVTGNLLGDTVWYLVGYAGKVERLAKIGRYVGIHTEHIEKLKVAIRAHVIKLILLAKLSISLMIPTLVAAGLARVPWRRWLPVVFVVELVWTGLLVWVGYHAAGLIARIEHSLQFIGVLAVAGLMVGTIVWYVRRQIQREEAEVSGPPQLANQQLLPQSKRQAKSQSKATGQRPTDPRRLNLSLNAEQPLPVPQESKLR
jgi:membrane protein DedA with SNARE-associated domain